MAGDTVQGIINRTVTPNFFQEFSQISSSYEDKVQQVLGEFFVYLDDYISSTRSKMDYATSALDQEEVKKVYYEAISLFREPIC